MKGVAIAIELDGVLVPGIREFADEAFDGLLDPKEYPGGVADVSKIRKLLDQIPLGKEGEELIDDYMKRKGLDLPKTVVIEKTLRKVLDDEGTLFLFAACPHPAIPQYLLTRAGLSEYFKKENVLVVSNEEPGLTLDLKVAKLADRAENSGCEYVVCLTDDSDLLDPLKNVMKNRGLNATGLVVDSKYGIRNGIVFRAVMEIAKVYGEAFSNGLSEQQQEEKIEDILAMARIFSKIMSVEEDEDMELILETHRVGSNKDLIDVIEQIESRKHEAEIIKSRKLGPTVFIETPEGRKLVHYDESVAASGGIKTRAKQSLTEQMTDFQIAHDPTQVAASGGLKTEAPSHPLEKMISPQIELKITAATTAQKKTAVPKEKLAPTFRRLLR
ncbi:hypothetical protein [Flavobacterium sp. LAR06]|uniref:hypothetical protein n=1 Tax=Flavobacterium sp. LAR06 TaxID=3064897 RepID=UPI0035BEF747